MGTLEFKDLDNLEGGADYERPLVVSIPAEILDVSQRGGAQAARSRADRPGKPDGMSSGRSRARHPWSSPSVSGPGDSLGAIALETHGDPYLRCRGAAGSGSRRAAVPVRPICKATHEDHELMGSLSGPCSLTTLDYLTVAVGTRWNNTIEPWLPEPPLSRGVVRSGALRSAPMWSVPREGGMGKRASGRASRWAMVGRCLSWA